MLKELFELAEVKQFPDESLIDSIDPLKNPTYFPIKYPGFPAFSIPVVIVIVVFICWFIGGEMVAVPVVKVAAVILYSFD